MLNIACKTKYKKRSRKKGQSNFHSGNIVLSLLQHDAFIEISIRMFNKKPERVSTGNLLASSPIFIFKNFSRAPPTFALKLFS